MKIIRTINGYVLGTDQGNICFDLPTFVTEQEAADWLVRITAELIALATAIDFDVEERDSGIASAASNLQPPKPSRRI